MEIKNFVPREYQENIVKTCLNKNTLVVLPTGTGKTKIALLLAVNRLKSNPNSKILLCTPTKPLANQICNEFKDFTTINKESIKLFTGAIKPEKRSQMWEASTVVTATPQTIQKDLENKRISLENVCLLVLDEAHHSRLKYANTIVAKYYNEQAKDPRILALTASPGGTRAKIEEIKKNLFVESVEIRADFDDDIKEHVQDKSKEQILIDLPEEFKQIRGMIKKVYKERAGEVEKFGLSKSPSSITKRDLIFLQNRLRKDIERGYAWAYYGLSLSAQLLKLDYMIELLETQGLKQFKIYFDKLNMEETKAARNIRTDKDILSAMSLTKKLLDKGVDHPKVNKLKELINKELAINKAAKVIVFANYRDTISEIISSLSKEGIKAVRFVGQANKREKGLNQKEQVEILRQFKDGLFNILVASSVAEEGIDIPEVAAVIFYEPVASELRKVQRSGRTGRLKPGKVIFLVTKGTKDEAYYWSSIRKENIMKRTLYRMQNKDYLTTNK